MGAGLANLAATGLAIIARPSIELNGGVAFRWPFDLARPSSFFPFSREAAAFALLRRLPACLARLDDRWCDL